MTEVVDSHSGSASASHSDSPSPVSEATAQPRRSDRAAREVPQVRDGSRRQRARILATSPRDAWLVAGAALYAAGLAATLARAAAAGPPGWARWTASSLGLAVGLVWMSNTVSHVHLHRPLFRSVLANLAFSLFLTVVLGIPQSAWRRRHLRHHGLPPAVGAASGLGERIELGLLLGVWIAAALTVPAAFFGAFLPVWLVGLALCGLQGHYEHVGGSAAGVDHHGRLYNRLWFNDGYHRHHHGDPTAHWTTLASAEEPAAPSQGRVSPWPPLLRWLEGLRLGREGAGAWARGLVPAALDGLERWALASRAARQLLLVTHAPALAALVAEMGEPAPRRICVVGGGLFPRTAILLGRLLPDAELVIVDADAAHLRAAARDLEREQARARANGGVRPGRITLVLGRCDGVTSSPVAAMTEEPPFDLVVVPLALRGDRAPFYLPRPGRHVLVHDWIWRRRGDAGRVVSRLLLKRVNLVRARPLGPGHGLAGAGTAGVDGGRLPGRDGRPRSEVPQLNDALNRTVLDFKGPSEGAFASTLPGAAAVEAKAEPPCRTTAPTTPPHPLPSEPVSSTTRPWLPFEGVIARLF